MKSMIKMENELNIDARLIETDGDRNRIKLLGSGPKINFDETTISKLKNEQAKFKQSQHWRISLIKPSENIQIYLDDKIKTDRSITKNGIKFILDPYTFDNLKIVDVESSDTNNSYIVRYSIYKERRDIIACGIEGTNCYGPQSDCC